MKHCKVSILLDDSTVSKFVTRKRIVVNNFPNCQNSVNRNMWFKVPMQRLDLCDCSDAFVVVKVTTDIRVVRKNSITQKVKIILHLGHAYQKSITHS